MEIKVSTGLIQKYLRGECSQEETAALLQWYSSFENEEDPILSLSTEEMQQLKLRMLEKIHSCIDVNLGQEASLPVRRHTETRQLLFLFSGVAAALLILYGIWFFLRPASKTALYEVPSNNIVVTNLTRSIHKVILSDSSVVWLSPESRLEYPERFTGKTRNVTMSGEAFFEVAKDHAHPFIILAGGLITKVWGTSFRIRAYENLPTEVSVLTGKVSVRVPANNRPGVMLYPNQKVTYVHKDSLLKQTDETAENSSLHIWRKVDLSFNNVPVRRVVAALNQQFDVHIVLHSEAAGNYLLNADFTNQNLPDILTMLEKSLNLNYVLQGREIILYSNAP